MRNTRGDYRRRYGEVRDIAHVHDDITRSARANRDAKKLGLFNFPPDTRGLTARAMGDPLPGRSALDRKRAEQ